MPLVRTADLVAAAYRAGTGLAAFNVITLEHAEAIVDGAQQADRPVILQISENAVKFHRGQLRPIVAAAAAVAAEASIPASVHLDHIEDLALLQASADTAVSSAMFDAARLDYDANIAATKTAAEWAHQRSMFLEAELGEVGGKDGAHAPGVRTDPDQAAAFVHATGVDALAVAVGSSHAMSVRTASLDFELIARLRSAVPVPLVLHGSSGVSDDDLRKAVSAGLTKINVGTLLNVRFTEQVRAHLTTDPVVTDPRKYLSPARTAISDAVSELLCAIS
ncbi:class II fructose-bisphosphate aldolase family protein [Mycobacterium sp. 21AC1]|uniref:class II fructose-bisphosphate aldolase n=1 Tax=[Mycobacterium] appelbergii TaxID=2939269 RepID=UPI0029393A9F|nr:class II fructose-bisphosphate aldolase [Mycobacterium sp. 21AC1]MDV3126481.1 class II fructose-bisphosphate aldolase family protein [Mycobacterium sp. 21AC1]